MHRSKAKLILLILFPAVVSLILSIFLITNFVYGELREQREHFTQAIVSQLTASTADYLVTEDLLGLNVVLGNLVSEGDLIFASVYKTDNKLVAQAGKTGVRQEDIVTRDISFQMKLQVTFALLSISLTLIKLSGSSLPSSSWFICLSLARPQHLSVATQT